MRSCALLFVFVSCCYSSQLQLSSNYTEVISHRYTFATEPRVATWPIAPFSGHVTSVSGNYLITSENTLWRYSVDAHGSLEANPVITWNNVPSDTSGCVLADSVGSSVWILCPSDYHYCDQHSLHCITTSVPTSAVNDAAGFPGSPSCLVGTQSGLVMLTVDAQRISASTSAQISAPVLSVAASASGVYAAGTANLLWRSGVAPGRLHPFKTPGIIDAAPRGLTFDPEDNLWIANEVCVNVQRRDLTFRRLGGRQGLPVGNLTSASTHAATGDVWLGSAHGVVRHRHSDRTWHYYNGPRYLASYCAVSAMHASPFGALVANRDGVAALVETPFSLQEKADLYEGITYRHQGTSPEAGRPYVGYLSNDCALSTFGNTSAWQPRSSDNSGLWTAIYLTGEILKYQVTKDPAVKAKAWKYFQGMQFLNTVTGVKGLMARSVLYQNEFPKFGHWVHSNTTPGWIWKRDTSSDEVDGHFLAYTMVYHLLAVTAAEKKQALDLIEDILHYIIDNGYMLIDVTGLPTTWGRWDPPDLNDDQEYYDERGLNSLQILSWIASAFGITGDQYYADAYDFLTEKHNYNINVINSKITQPSDDNYSDDELEYVPLLTFAIVDKYASSTLSKRLRPYVLLCANRTWEIVSNYRATPYAAITHMLMGSLSSSSQYSEAVLTLQQWNMEFIRWPMDNTRRLDFVLDRDEDREGKPQMLPPVYPFNEIGISRWNTNPYSLQTGGNGLSEADPGAFVFAYWLARFTGAF